LWPEELRESATTAIAEDIPLLRLLKESKAKFGAFKMATNEALRVASS